jgi:hypothetical protein
MHARHKIESQFHLRDALSDSDHIVYRSSGYAFPVTQTAVPSAHAYTQRFAQTTDVSACKEIV